MIIRNQLNLIRNIYTRRANYLIFKILATRHLSRISQKNSIPNYTHPSVFRRDYSFRKMSAKASAIQEDGPVYFWKPEQEDGYLGQWYESDFVNENGTKFNNAEKWLMYQKAMLFAPESQWPQWILENDDPKSIKAMGREVPDFDEDKWVKERMRIAYEGNMLKFSQDENLKMQLLATGDRELVEASPRDRIWGVGYGKKNAGNMRHKWGLNLLGKALMDVRKALREQEKTAGEA